jgi:hypothetical protein
MSKKEPIPVSIFAPHTGPKNKSLRLKLQEYFLMVIILAACVAWLTYGH